MRRADYIDILRGSARRAQLDPDNLSPDEATDLNGYHSERLHQIWREADWPELVLCQKRYFRPFYLPGSTTSGALTVDSTLITVDTGASITADMTTLAGGGEIVRCDECYWGVTRKYYQALKNFTHNSPTTDPTTAAGLLNTAYWAELLTNYSGAEYSDTAVYAVGDTVFYLGDERFYALHTAAPVGTLPTDAGYWGILTEFQRYVAYEQAGKTPFEDGLRAWDRDPRQNGDAIPLTAYQTDLGAHVLDDLLFCWLEFRIRCPLLGGDVFSATSTYAVGDQVYFSSATVPGNFYKVLTAPAVGESPASHASKWELLAIPMRFQRFLVHAGAADYAEADERETIAGRELALSTQELERQQLSVFGQNLNLKRTRVLTR